VDRGWRPAAYYQLRAVPRAGNDLIANIHHGNVMCRTLTDGRGGGARHRVGVRCREVQSILQVPRQTTPWKLLLVCRFLQPSISSLKIQKSDAVRVLFRSLCGFTTRALPHGFGQQNALPGSYYRYWHLLQNHGAVIAQRYL
jgi:hypothetical protein